MRRVTGGAHTISGYAGEVGYAAIAGLVTIRVQQRDRSGPVRRAGGLRAAVDNLLPATCCSR